MTAQRSAQDVTDDHLSPSVKGTVDEDLERNFAPDVVIVSNWGVKRGHDGIREMARLLRSQLPEFTSSYKLRLIEDRIEVLEWTAESAAGRCTTGSTRTSSPRAYPRADDPLHPHARWLSRAGNAGADRQR